MSDQQPYLATGVLASMYKDIPGAGMGALVPLVRCENISFGWIPIADNR